MDNKKRYARISALDHCEFCGWVQNENNSPLIIHSKKDYSDLTSCCPKCGIELLNQIRLEDVEELPEITKDLEK